MNVESWWILGYVVLVMLASFAGAWYLDQRENDAEDAERMRQHLDTLKRRSDTYLDPAGWNQ